jgi:scyllo-inositol 2-dehydrogenase (NADP+)
VGAVHSGVGLGGMHGGMGDGFRGHLDYEWMTAGHFVGHPCVGDYTVRNTHAALGLKIAAAGRQHGVVFSTYHNRHWDGWILRAVEWFKAGALGDIVRIDLRTGSHSRPGDWWRSSRSISGGILYDWGVHLLEYSLQLITPPAREVSGYAWHGYWASQPDFRRAARRRS